MAKKNSGKQVKEFLSRLDNFENTLTNLGIQGKDKRMSALPQKVTLTKTTLNALYQGNDLAARIIDIEPEALLRQGFKVKVYEDSKQELGDLAMEKYRDYDLHSKLMRTMKEARLYGTSGMYVGISNQKPTEELNYENVAKIDFFVILDRFRLTPSSTPNRDLNSANFGMPDTYSVSMSGVATNANENTFHHSRYIRFDGIELPWNIARSNNYWGETVLSRNYKAILNYDTAHDAIATLMQEVSVGIVKIKDLTEIMSGGNLDLLRKRMELLSAMSSVCNAIVVEEGEDYERTSMNLSGADKMLEKMGNRLVASTCMPHTLLLGESPTGLGDSGQSEKTDWYDNVKNKQEHYLKPRLKMIFDLIFAEKEDGINNGQIPDYDIEFNPLWQLDEKEMAETREIMSRADERYYNMGAITAEEIGKSRFAGDKYSIDTDYDESLDRELQETPEPEENEEPENNEEE